MGLVQSAAFLGGYKDNANLEREARAATLHKVVQGRGDLTTEVREVQSIPALPIVPVNVDGFCWHDDP